MRTRLMKLAGVLLITGAAGLATAGPASAATVTAAAVTATAITAFKAVTSLTLTLRTLAETGTSTGTGTFAWQLATVAVTSLAGPTVIAPVIR